MSRPDYSAAVPEAETAVQLAGRLRKGFDATLAPVVAGQRCALVDFPNHGNVGDNAIWLGELAALRRCGASVGYFCDWQSYDRRALAAAVPEGPILLHGGGNVGDVWTIPQRLREQILADFPRRRIVQLPQSVWFRSRERRETFLRALDSHGHVLLLLRDPATVSSFESLERTEVALCPDGAFAIDGPVLNSGTRPTTGEVVWLLRADVESNGYRGQADIPGGVTQDWRAVCEPLNRAARLVGRVVAGASRTNPALVGKLAPWLIPGARALAELRLHRGLDLLARRVVVSDRLHAHILAVLTGRASVVLDSRSGKNHTFVKAWTRHLPDVATASTVAEAALAVERLLTRSA